MANARLISVDPSLTCSGWALFRIEQERLVAVGKFKSLPPSVPMAQRLSELQGKVRRCFEDLEIAHGDFLVCEAATTMRDPRAALLVEQVRTLIETVARERGATVPGRVNPRTVHLEVMGLRGKQMPRAEIKATALGVVETLYRKELQSIGFPTTVTELKRHQDIVDAILIGVVAMGRLRSARVSGMLPETLFDVLVRRTPRLRVRAGAD